MRLKDANIDSYNFSLIAGTLLLSVMVVFIIYFIFLHYRVRQKFEWEREQFKQALLQAEVEIREHTLKQISLELHDNVGQIASLVKINLNILATEAQEKEKERINESIDLLRRMIQDIKSLAASLNNESLVQMKFIPSIEHDIQRINKLNTVQIDYNHAGIFPKLKPGIEIFLYRMVQEMTGNMLKHAGATLATLNINNNDQNLTIVFSDNGCGFDQKTAMTKGAGLGNLEKRCKIIGANLEIKSTPGSGTQISVVLPLNPIKP